MLENSKVWLPKLCINTIGSGQNCLFLITILIFATLFFVFLKPENPNFFQKLLLLYHFSKYYFKTISDVRPKAHYKVKEQQAYTHCSFHKNLCWFKI